METPREQFMRRAFALAACGQGYASPNPVVGCVVVWQDQIIGEGFHRCYGKEHAEVNAIDAVLAPNAFVAELCRKTGKTPQALLQECTLYVTLEPCSHYGKQPPCAEKIIRHKIPRVVVACADPNPAVNGKGVRMLREAGVEVQEHFLEAEGHELGRRFFTNIEQQRPYIILKWAQTADAFITSQQGINTKITGKVLQVLNHLYRVQEDAVMVGTSTVLADNPRLDARLCKGRQPMRIGFDLHGRILKHLKNADGKRAGEVLHFFDGSLETVLFVNEKEATDYAGLQADVGENLHILGIKAPFDLRDCMAQLHALRVGSLIVEGGTELLQSFIRQNLFDEVRVFESDKRLGKGYAAPSFEAKLVSESRYDGEFVRIYRNI